LPGIDGLIDHRDEEIVCQQSLAHSFSIESHMKMIQTPHDALRDSGEVLVLWIFDDGLVTTERLVKRDPRRRCVRLE
jgi:hypothetical protein